MFAYKISEARSCAILDCFEQGLEVLFDLKMEPRDTFAGPDFRYAVTLPLKALEPDAEFTADEITYLLSDKVLYWNWAGERPTF
jgi:hypothetical protein